MVVEGFAERRGARPVTKDVSRVAIVITDGRSQDNVTEPSKAARNLHVNTFAIGKMKIPTPEFTWRRFRCN